MKVKLTVTESACRGGYCKTGNEIIVDDLCPPICHELWKCIYPYVCALQNGGDLDYGSTRKMEPDPDMQQAYSEMLDGCIRHPEQRLWYIVWNMLTSANLTQKLSAFLCI